MRISHVNFTKSVVKANFTCRVCTMVNSSYCDSLSHVITILVKEFHMRWSTPIVHCDDVWIKDRFKRELRNFKQRNHQCFAKFSMNIVISGCSILLLHHRMMNVEVSSKMMLDLWVLVLPGELKFSSDKVKSLHAIFIFFNVRICLYQCFLEWPMLKF